MANLKKDTKQIEKALKAAEKLRVFNEQIFSEVDRILPDVGEAVLKQEVESQLKTLKQDPLPQPRKTQTQQAKAMVQQAQSARAKAAEDAQLKALRRQLKIDAAAKHAFAMLTLTVDATPEQVREKYLMLAKDVHPDKFLELAKKHRATQIFQKLNTAYKTLKDKKLAI